MLARCRNAPSTPFFITAAIPLIPGSTLYYCMNAVVSNDLPAAEHFGEQTFLAALGIAGGMAIAWCLADLSRKLRGRLYSACCAAPRLLDKLIFSGYNTKKKPRRRSGKGTFG